MNNDTITTLRKTLLYFVSAGCNSTFHTLNPGTHLTIIKITMLTVITITTNTSNKINFF